MRCLHKVPRLPLSAGIRILRMSQHYMVERQPNACRSQAVSWGPRRTISALARLTLEHGTRRCIATLLRSSRGQPQRLDPSAASADASSPGLRADSVASVSEPTSASQLQLRILAGATLGAIGGLLVAAGGIPYLLFMEFFVFHCIQEYFGMDARVGIRHGRQPPPVWGTSLVTLCCLSLPVYNFVTGKIALAFALATFIMCSVFITTTETPTLATITSPIFGLFYCGYLPSFWVKMRSLAVPALNCSFAAHWPTWLGGVSHVTVGFIATFTSIACIVSADVGAFVVGKTLGRTPLTTISPKKTVEGAVGGCVASMLCALAIRTGTGWPASPVATAGLGILAFGSSILGDLIESVIKRDAGLKDSGTLIPGHGGVLDRFDSYIFTGAVVYFYLRCLPVMGV